MTGSFRSLRGLAVLGALLALPANLTADDGPGAPLSAIDWLSRALEMPLPQTPVPEDAPVFALPESEPPGSQTDIVTAPLDGAGMDTAGLFPSDRIGLPRDMWANSLRSEVIETISRLPLDTLPTAARLTLRLLQAEFAPPIDDVPGMPDALLLARVERLFDMGALEQAGQVIAAVPQPGAALNAWAFDIALLLGEEDRACAGMQGQFATKPGLAAQIYCLARGGDWQAAYSSLVAAQALHLLNDNDARLLARFLEEEDAEVTLPLPQVTTPFGWRIMEALGDPVTTAGLPIAFAHADLRGTSGWRAQIEAAERLTRAGVLQPNRLYGLYTERRAAASGGLWERVRIVQELERALTQSSAGAASEALVQAWPLFSAVELEVALAQMQAEALSELPVTGAGRDILWRLLALLEETPERLKEFAPSGTTASLVMALASGADPFETSSPPMASAIVAGFSDGDLPNTVQEQLQDGAFGLVLMEGLMLLSQASGGDLNAASGGLRRLRALGLDDVARQVAIELLLLERRG